MKKTNKTLAIYGIQDSVASSTPFNVHDHALVLFENGKINNFIQLERLSGVKSDNNMREWIYPVLQKMGITGRDDVDFVFTDNVLGRSFINDIGNIRFEISPAVSIKNNIEKGRMHWLDHHRPAYLLNHELSHIYSCTPFFGDFEESSLMVHFDGGASLSNFSAWQRRKGKDILLEADWGLKPITAMWNANALIFHIVNADRHNHLSVPGKLMGLAAYGEYSKKIHTWLEENDFFASIWRKNSIFFEKANRKFAYSKKSFSTEDSFIQDIAATIQEIFCRKLESRMQSLFHLTKAKRVYYTGGSALNIVANRRILENSGFQELLIPPCANDSGLALGAGAYLELKKHGYVQKVSPYLNNFGLLPATLCFNDIPLIAECLINKKVIGVVNESGEIGPRALGNRSILSLANDKDLSRKVSMEIKGREWYRPLAPVALEESLKKYTGKCDVPLIADYMLMEYPVKKQFHQTLAGVVHHNGTARFQCIRNEKQNPFLYRLLLFLLKEYNVGALINTSFNYRGEPIVHTFEQAEVSAKKMHLDAIVLNGKMKIIKEE
jgi:carbamoyltransferase